MHVRRALLLVLALVVLAACTGDGDGDAEDEVPAAPAEVAPAASSGCTAQPVEPTTEPERVEVTSSGEERWYLRAVPPAAAEGAPLPVVVDFHGYLEGAQVHVEMTALADDGVEHGFVTVFPHGDGGGRTVPSWDPFPGSDDLTFFGDLLDDLEATLCIDTNRVYVTGLSNGAFMVSAIACEYAERVAAVAMVAGVRHREGCDPARPVPILAFHGTADDFVGFEGGLGSAAVDLPAPDGEGTLGEAVEDVDERVEAERTAPPVPDIVAAWATRHGCDEEPVETRVADEVLHLAHECPPGVAVELYVVEGGGHAWPGSEFSAAVEAVVGLTTFSISANEIMWEFFEAHPLPPDDGDR